jgi:hypothetical protein
MANPHGESPQISLEKATELQLLAYDVQLIQHVGEQTARQHIIDVPTEDHARYFAIAGDLWVKLLSHCQAVSVLLPDLFDPAVVVSRAAYEAGITLVYLMTVGDKLANARLYEARTVLEVLETYAAFQSDPGIVDAQRRAPQIDAVTMNEARHRKAKRRPWSGKTVAEMATAIKVEGHKAAYSIQSWAAHSSVGGWRGDISSAGDGTVRWQWGKPASQRNVQAVANHTRRTLHSVYQIFLPDVYGVLPKLATLDPHKSNKQAIESPAD